MVNTTVTLLDSVSAIRPRVLDSANCPTESQVAKFSVRRRQSAFTLVELLISVGVLVLLVLLATQLLNSAATITTLGQKQMDANSQARQLLDRMAVDFGHFVRRSDLDYFAKNTTTPNSQGGAMAGNDQIAFYSIVPGYYPASGSPSPISLIAYRVNAQNRLERMGKGLVWSSVSNADPTSVVFLPLKIADTWPTAVNLSAPPTPAPDAEVVGSRVFRFEYCYLLTNGTLSAVASNVNAIAAIVVDIGIIDPRSKVLLNDAQVATFTTPGNPNFLSDYISGMRPGQLVAQWQNTLNGITSLPRPAISGIRLYERFFYLAPSSL
jgi:type II secretory pathway pseudopilin PulG